MPCCWRQVELISLIFESKHPRGGRENGDYFRWFTNGLDDISEHIREGEGRELHSHLKRNRKDEKEWKREIKEAAYEVFDKWNEMYCEREMPGGVMDLLWSFCMEGDKEWTDLVTVFDDMCTVVINSSLQKGS